MHEIETLYCQYIDSIFDRCRFLIIRRFLEIFNTVLLMKNRSLNVICRLYIPISKANHKMLLSKSVVMKEKEQIQAINS